MAATMPLVMGPGYVQQQQSGDAFTVVKNTIPNVSGLAARNPGQAALMHVMGSLSASGEPDSQWLFVVGNQTALYATEPTGIMLRPLAIDIAAGTPGLNGLWQRFLPNGICDARVWGCRCDNGVTDNASLLQAAINWCHPRHIPVFMPPVSLPTTSTSAMPYYGFLSSVVLNISEGKLWGAGHRGTQCRFTDCHGFIIGNASSTITQHVEIRDFLVRGSAPTSASPLATIGVWIRSAIHCTIDNVNLYDFCIIRKWDATYANVFSNVVTRGDGDNYKYPNPVNGFPLFNDWMIGGANTPQGNVVRDTKQYIQISNYQPGSFTGDGASPRFPATNTSATNNGWLTIPSGKIPLYRGDGWRMFRQNQMGRLKTATLVSGGSGNAVGDVLVVQGGVFQTASSASTNFAYLASAGTYTSQALIKVLTVDGNGTVLTFSIPTIGIYQTVPTGTVATTNSTTTSATPPTFTLTWNSTSVSYAYGAQDTDWFLYGMDDVVSGVDSTGLGTYIPGPPASMAWALDANGNYSASPATIYGSSVATVTFPANPSAGDTVTIGGVAITFVASGATGNQVAIGAGLAATLTSLAAFLSASSNATLLLSTYAATATALAVTSNYGPTGYKAPVAVTASVASVATALNAGSVCPRSAVTGSAFTIFQVRFAVAPPAGLVFQVNWLDPTGQACIRIDAGNGNLFDGGCWAGAQALVNAQDGPNVFRPAYIQFAVQAFILGPGASGSTCVMPPNQFGVIAKNHYAIDPACFRTTVMANGYRAPSTAYATKDQAFAAPSTGFNYFSWNTVTGEGKLDPTSKWFQFPSSNPAADRLWKSYLRGRVSDPTGLAKIIFRVTSAYSGVALASDGITFANTYTDAPISVQTSALGSGSIVFSANPSANQTVTINGTVFTFVAMATTTTQVTIGASLAVTLVNLASVLNASTDANAVQASYTANTTTLTATFKTPAAGSTFTLAASAAAVSGPVGTITWTTNPANGATVTIGGTVVTFTTGAVSGNQVAIGATLAATIASLVTFCGASSDGNLSLNTYASSAGVLTVTHIYAATGLGTTLAASSGVNATTLSDATGEDFMIPIEWVDTTGLEHINGSQPYAWGRIGANILNATTTLVIYGTGQNRSTFGVTEINPY